MQGCHEALDTKSHPAVMSEHSIIAVAAGVGGLSVSDLLFEMSQVTGVKGKECLSSVHNM